MKGSVRFRSAAVAVAAAAAVGGGLATAPAASAAPTGCTASGGSLFATAYCTGGNGYYQAYAVCKMTWWPFNTAFTEGSWKRVGSGQASVAFCPFTYSVVYRGIGLRN